MSATSGDQTVAIVGGGAIGAALFACLVDRMAEASPRARIVLFEKAERIGPGLAYSDDASSYRLNQSAQTMSLVPGRRTDFCDWLEARGHACRDGAEVFCERSLFGDYVADAFERAMDRARRRGLHVSTVRDEVTTLSRRAHGHRVVTKTHAPVDADVVVLAIGNLPSTRFRALEGPRFIASPYPSAVMQARVPRDARVAILGTGLSAIDAALALFAAGHTGRVVMASRGGLLPAVRGPLPPHELRHVTRANIAAATDHGRRPLAWSTLLRWLEMELERHDRSVSWDRDFPAWADPIEHLASQIAAAERGARAWQSIGEALNPMIEVVWRHLADDDRHLFLDRFYGRFMSWWVPIPLVNARQMLALLQERKVSVERGVEGVTYDASAGLHRVQLAGGRNLELDVVVDATGIPRHVRDCGSVLLRSLVEQGIVAAHESGGIRVDFESLRVLGKDGRADSALFALGNLTSGTHLFTSTLELNVEKAARLTAHIASELHRRSEKEHAPHVDATPHST
jgi:uncharacterized NAD(P)/FAD-binding protein YdhS